MGFGLLAVLVVLLAQFRRARLAFVVLGSVPLAVVGALVTRCGCCRYRSTPPRSWGASCSSGLVVKNGILLLEQFERLLEAGQDVERALVHAGPHSRPPDL